ncbi:hypothetical protein N7540_010853 [Penicillium herquei]|nr:hypothetical protein N7540_010853 [Penicillium herquei]
MRPLFFFMGWYEQSIGLLDRWNLVNSSSSQNTDSALKIHRELRRRILITANPTDLQRAFVWALKKLREVFPHQSPFAEPLSRKWKQCGRWISHVISVRVVAVSFRSKLEIPEVLIELLVDGGIYLWERGMLDQGYKLLESAEDMCNTISHCSQPLRAAVYSFRGCILSDKGRIDDAIECFRKEVNHRREHLRSLRKPATIVDEIQLANGYNNLACILCASGAISEAEINNELSITIKERWKKFGNLDYLFSLSYSNRANVLGLQQKWVEAAIWYNKALEIPRERHYSPRLALIYHNFGTMRLQQGNLDEATKLLADAVELRTEELGHHYDTANSLHTLATCYRRAGKLFEAKDVLIEALEILNSPHLRDSARIARSKYALSLVLEKLGDPEALVLREEARRMKAELPVTTRTRSAGGEIDASSDDSEADYDCLVPYV